MSTTEAGGGRANGSSNTIKLAITKAGKEALERIAERYGMKEYVAAGRIYEWFVRQDDIVQRAVLGLLEGLEVDAATRFMQRLAAEAESGPEKDVPDVSVDGTPDPLPNPPGGNNVTQPPGRGRGRRRGSSSRR